MTGDGARKLSEALEESFGQLEPVVEQIPALLGCVIGGQKTIVVSDDPDYVWCRISGNESRRVKAFNQHAGGVAQHYDLPIIIVKDKLNPNIWKVMGRDVTRYPSWGQVANYPYSSPYIAHHGADHSFSAQRGMGADPVWVFKRQMMPLLPHPAISGSMGIEIGSDFYYFNEAYRWFSSTGTVDFTSYLPTGASNGKFVTTYIDGTTGNPAYLDGGEFNAITPPIDPGDFIAIPTAAQGIAVAAVFLLSGTQRIGWSEIYDLRHPHVPVPVSDHGNLGGLADDDHTQYVLVDGSRTMTGNLGVGGDIHVTGSVYSGDGSFYTAGWLQTVDRADPSTPPSGQGRYYSKAGKPYFINDSDEVYDLTGTGSVVAGGGWLEALSIRMTSNLAVADSTWTTVVFHAEEQDDWSAWSSASGTNVVLDETGVYQVSGQTFWDLHATGQRYIRIIRNGDEALELLEVSMGAHAGAQLRQQIGGLVRAEAGDYLQMQVYQTRGGSLNLLGGAVDKEATRLWAVKLKA